MLVVCEAGTANSLEIDDEPGSSSLPPKATLSIRRSTSFEGVALALDGELCCVLEMKARVE